MGLERFITVGGEQTSTSPAVANERLISDVPARLYSLHVFNNGPAQFIALLDRAAIPSPGAELSELVYAIGAGAELEINFENGRPFSQGIYVCNSTVFISNTLGAADCVFDATFARS